MRVHIITYGCSNNQAESQMMAALLEKEGKQIVDNTEDADAIVFNTCSVKSATEQKIFHDISSAHKNDPDKHIVVAGCMPEAEYEKVKQIAPYASFLSTNHLDRINEAIGSRVKLIGKTKLEKISFPKSHSQYQNIVPIASGCLSACTFCSTKIAKGSLVSYDPEKIICEISQEKDGCKEFWLTAQDCSCYGFDIGTNMPGLIKGITTSVRGQYFLRVGMMNPQHTRKILPELIEAYRSEHVFKFLHIPVQSGSQKILDTMNRGYRVEDFIDIAREFRKEIPSLTLWTDMIIGFPTERGEDFEASIQLLREIKPDFTNVSAYSVRPNTKAAKMKQIPTEVKKDRTRRISKIVKQIALEQNKKWIGWSGPALIDEYNKEKGNFIGRNFAYKPIALEGQFKLGEFIDVKITSASHTCLKSKTISLYTTLATI